ncbi:MAG: nucleotide sugar dehydrogenase [Deltaproteobacteria bacterium]|nr:nucleotide sugar dehydrogenase [Deltaproteobacteria bacterium]MBW2071718.1 nucleotide sugar dehydrogenase [Deltaproteobacteria bacterium]
MKEQLISKIRSRQSMIGIIGLGYVGLPLMLRFTEERFPVVGFDIDKNKVVKLNKGESYIGHIASEEIAARRAEVSRISDGKEVPLFEATTNYSRSAEMDVLILCVPTPLDIHREPDLSFVRSTMTSIYPHLRPGQMLCLESTTYPGTTEEELQPMIESRGLTVGKDIFLVYSPEREDPGNPKYHTRNIPRVCGGVTENCLEVGVALYGEVVERVVPVSSTRAAELTKLLENIYRAVNIGLVNELKMVADRMGIDIHEVIDAAATKPFGFTPFHPGPGLGGHCIPIDPFYLTWKARAFGLNTRFIELAGEVNTAMPHWVVEKVAEGLNNRGKPIKGAKILVLGLAYKKNVDDPRESPAMEIMEILRAKGAEVSYSDPYIRVFPRMRRYHFNLKSVELTPENLQSVDCVVLVTDHDAFPYDAIERYASLIVDSRGVYRQKRDNVIKA